MLIGAAVLVNGAVGVLQIVQSQKFAVDIAPGALEGQYMAMANSAMNLFGVIALTGMGQMASLTAQSLILALSAVIALTGSILFCRCKTDAGAYRA